MESNGQQLTQSLIKKLENNKMNETTLTEDDAIQTIHNISEYYKKDEL